MFSFWLAISFPGQRETGFQCSREPRELGQVVFFKMADELVEWKIFLPMAALSRMKCTNVTLQSPKLEAASTIYAWALPKISTLLPILSEILVSGHWNRCSKCPSKKYNIQTILDSLKPTLCGDKAEKVLPFLYQKLGFFLLINKCPRARSRDKWATFSFYPSNKPDQVSLILVQK